MTQALAWHEAWKDHEPEDRKDPPHNAIKITTGTGKSELGRQAIARFVIEARSSRTAAPCLAPRADAQARGRGARARCPTASPRRSGKAAKAPSSAPTSRCAAISRRSRPRSRSARRSKRPSASDKEARCPFYDTCHYQAQKAPPKRPMSCSRRTKPCFRCRGARQELRPCRRRRRLLAGRHHRHPPRHRQTGSRTGSLSGSRSKASAKLDKLRPTICAS